MLCGLGVGAQLDAGDAHRRAKDHLVRVFVGVMLCLRVYLLNMLAKASVQDDSLEYGRLLDGWMAISHC